MKTALPIDRPVQLAQDMETTTFENVDLTLHELYAHAARKGSYMLKGLTFKGCRIQGPGVMLVGTGVTFDDSNFGDSRGDIRNLVMRPAGDKAVGTVPVFDCAFQGCEFYYVGFTGHPAFIEQLLSLSDAPASVGGAA